MWQSTALIAAVLALASWIVICLAREAPRIEGALYLEATRALEAAGLPEVQPKLRGRDVTLQGLVSTPSHIAGAERAIAGVAGVRVIRSQLEVRELPVAPPAYLEIRTEPGGVALSGGVPSEARRLEVLERARQIFGADRVDEQLTVNAAVEDGVALTAAAGVVAALADAGDGVKVRLRGDRLRLSGTVASAEARRRLEDRLRAAVPERRLFFSTLRAGPPPEANDRDPGGS